jgi:hypothetical protein
MQHNNEYVNMLNFRMRQQELMEQAEKHRIATVTMEEVRRQRQAQRNNTRKNNG